MSSNTSTYSRALRVLPVPQHVRGQSEPLCDIADGEHRLG